MRYVCTVALAFAVAACGQPGATAPVEPAAVQPPVAAPAPTPAEPEPAPPTAPELIIPTPPAILAEMFGGTCSWGEAGIQGVTIWGYSCPDDRLVTDAVLPGVRREFLTDGVVEFDVVVVQLFPKAPDGDIASVLPAVVAVTPEAAGCAFVARPDLGHFELQPIGDLAIAYQAFLDGTADGPGLPCGKFGPSESGQVTFHLFPGRQDVVAALVLPSDIPSFDPNTLSAG